MPGPTLLDVLRSLGVVPEPAKTREEYAERVRKFVHMALHTPGAFEAIVEHKDTLHIMAHIVGNDRWPEARLKLVALHGESNVAFVETRARLRCDGKCHERARAGQT